MYGQRGRTGLDEGAAGRAYAEAGAGVDILDSMFERIDAMRKARDAKQKAERDYQRQVVDLDLDARDKVIGTVAIDPATGNPKLTPFTAQQQQEIARRRYAAQMAALGMPLPPDGAPAPMQAPAQAAQPTDDPTLDIPTGPGGAQPQFVQPAQGAAPTAPAPAPAAAPVSAQPGTSWSSPDAAQIANSPFVAVGYTSGPNGLSISYKRQAEVMKDMRTAAGKPIQESIVTKFMQATSALNDIRTLKKLVASGKYNTGPVLQGGDWALSDHIGANFARQDDPDTTKAAMVALERLMRNDFLSAATGAQRGFKEMIDLIKGLPLLGKDQPDKYISTADMIEQRIQNMLDLEYEFLRSSGYNADGIRKVINDKVMKPIQIARTRRHPKTGKVLISRTDGNWEEVD